MSHRIRDAFAKAKNEGRGAFVAYLTMGFPTIEASERAADEAIAGGADILELGVPFSDPFADGGVIRSAAYEALRNGATLNGSVGIDAVLVVDLPLEEREELLAQLRPRGVGFVPLIAPNTPLERVQASEQGIGDSFLYVITVKGTTGERTALPPDLTERLDAIRAAVHLPIAAGFGISTRAQADEVSRHADGFIVGSALVKCVAEGRPPCLN